MVTETMNIRTAQDEKKILDKKIGKAFEQFCPVVAVSAISAYVGSFSKEEYSNKVQSDYQSLNDLIKRREAIVKAIMDANIENKVKVRKFTGLDSLSKLATELTEEDYEEITIANAIARKKYFEASLCVYIDKVENKINAHLKDFKKAKENAAAHVDKLVNERFAGQQNVSQDARERAVKTESERFEIFLINPLNAEEVVNQADEAILDYIKELNSSLSRITEITEVTVTY